MATDEDKSKIDKDYDEKFDNPKKVQDGKDSESKDSTSQIENVKDSEAKAESSDPFKTPDGSEGFVYKKDKKYPTNKWFIKDNLKRKSALGGVIALLISTIAIVMFAVFGSVPSKFIHLAEFLQSFHFSDQDTVSAQRINRLVIYARIPKDGLSRLQDTRLGFLETKQANRWERRLLDSGLRAEYVDGDFDRMSFDADRIKADSKNADLKDLEGEELRRALARKLNIDIDKVSGSGKTFTISAEGTKNNRRIITNSVRTVSPDLPLGRAVASFNARKLIKKANFSFNPITRVKNDVKKVAAEKYKDWYDKRRAKFTGSDADITKVVKADDPDRAPDPNNPEEAKISDANNEVKESLSDKSKLRGLATKTGGAALAILGVMCAARDVSSEVSKINYANKANVLLQGSGEVLGIGSKLQEGFDKDSGEALVDAETLGEFHKLYGMYAMSSAYQYAAGSDDPGTPTFERPDYAAFNVNTGNAIESTNAFFQKLQETALVGVSINAICGAFTFVGDAVSTVVSTITAGLSTQVEEFLVGQFLNILSTEAEDPTKEEYEDSPVGGELATAGTLLAANEAFNAAGARPLTEAERQRMSNNTVAYESQNDNRSLIAKATDFSDHKSLATKLYASYNINTAKNGALGVLTLFSSGLTNLFNPRAQAAEEDWVRYFYGIPKTGFDTNKLNAETYEDPYENADWVANNLTLESDSVKRFQECTGATVNEDWSFDVLPYPEGLVNYDNLPDYCRNDDDEGLYRLRVLALDTTNFDSYMCLYEEDAESCQNVYGSQAQYAEGEASFRAATFNVLGNQHTEPGGKLPRWPSGTERMEKAFEVITNNSFDVVGLQELERPQREKLIELAGDNWGIHPAQPTYERFKSPNSIIWNKSVFELVDSGYSEGLDYLGSSKMDAPWVDIRHLPSGQIIHYQNTHDPANVNGNQEQQDRASNARKHKARALERINNGENVLVVGDFNSSSVLRSADAGLTRGELTYCILTDGGQIQNAYDTAKGSAGYCPTRSASDFGIDHIYHGSDIGISDRSRVANLQAREISDHPAVYADVVIATAAATATSCADPNSTAVYWPIAAPRTFSNSHDIAVNAGTPVYAIKSGSVIASEDLIGCDATPTNGRRCNEGMKSYGRLVRIDHGIDRGVVTYAHLQERQVQVGDTVAAGQQIALSGNSGNSFGPHLHVDFNYGNSLTVFEWLRANSAIEPPCDPVAGLIFWPKIIANSNKSEQPVYARADHFQESSKVKQA